MVKQCPRCGVEKDETDFCKNIKRKDGLSCYCKECSRKMQRAWWNISENREDRNKKSAERYNLKKEEINKKRRERRMELIKNPDFCKTQLERGREYRIKNREKIDVCRKNYYEENKESMLKKSYELKKKTVVKHIEKMGGKCMRCGYNLYVGVLDLHHINEIEKESLYDRSKSKLDYNKFMLLCANCHRELHGGVWK